MQAFARYFGQDTAFLLSTTLANADLRIRYFVPDHEMGISGHATIAAVTVALKTGKLKVDSARLETISGLFPITSSAKDGRISVTLEQNLPIFGGKAQVNETAHALGIAPAEIDTRLGPLQSVSASRPKLIVPLRNMNVLNSLQPHFEELWSLCDKTKVTGVYTFTVGADANLNPSARQFPLRAGFPEDPATGVAAAALGAYLTRYHLGVRSGVHTFQISQGVAMGAPSRIETHIGCVNGAFVRVAIRGSADIEGQETFTFDELGIHQIAKE
jgi:PhzF family phenazine biosynthesis protein